MNILLITIWKPRKGGIVRRVENLIKFSRQNFDIVTYRRSIALPFFRALAFIVDAVFQSLHKKNFDIIHAHYALPQGMAGVIVKKLTGKPLVLTVHGSDVLVLGKNPIFRILLKITLRNSDMVIAVSGHLRKKVIEMGNREERVKVIYGGVDRSGRALKKKTEKKVVFVGSLVPQKGVDILLKAFEDIEGAELLIVGEGKERKKLEAIARGNVYFLGEASKVDEILSRSSVLVLPSREEGFGLVLLEAMSLGLPVIATKVGGIPEIVNGKNGILIEAEDVEQLKRAIEKILNDVKLGRKLGAAGIKYSARYSWRRMATEVEKIYKNLLREQL